MTNDESRSDLNPSDEESVSTYSAISELEGVGPPTILQYIKESTRVKRAVPAPKPLSERLVVSFYLLSILYSKIVVGLHKVHLICCL